MSRAEGSTRAFAVWMSAWVIAGCGAANVAERTTPRTVDSQRAEAEAPRDEAADASDGARATTPLDVTVETRLAALPAPPVPWRTRMNAITVEQLTQIAAFERESTSVTPVEMTCSNGSTVRVGGDGTWDPIEAQVAAYGVGVHCPITIGDVIACRIAVREHPCNYLGAALPECHMIEACVDSRMEQLERELITYERVGGRL